jgi:hypothetical protein
MQIQFGALSNKALLDNCSGQSLQSFFLRTRPDEKRIFAFVQQPLVISINVFF